MSIEAFVRDEVLRPRLEQAGCMVVYDPKGRYRDACLALHSEEVSVVDASRSSIEAREQALRGLASVGQGTLRGLLVYVPAERPLTDEKKQVDPFSVFSACGAVFPQDDGDEYLSLCLRARPDFATDVRRVFSDVPEGPPFAVVDAIGGGVSWPQLRSALRVESAREILTALLAPRPEQTLALESSETWLQEATGFLQATLRLSLKTRGKTWKALSEELWRYLLFSEFVFDLPGELPPALRAVPHAAKEARQIVEDVCDQLRMDPRTRKVFIDRAQGVEAELNLVEACRGIGDLGVRETFPFEERTFLQAAIRAVLSNDRDAARVTLQHHGHSVWLGNPENQAQWDLVASSLRLIESCEDHDRQLPERSRSQADVLDFYVGSLRETDRLQREFEQAVGDLLQPFDELGRLIELARSRYGALTERVQNVFVKHLETSGWPPAGRTASTTVFDRLVADHLKERGKRVAYLMVDALRYELGVALEKLLSEDGPVDLTASYAQLPTVTPVGMASLLPGAGSLLTLGVEGGALVPRLDGQPVTNVTQRMDVLSRRYGDRFAHLQLNEFARQKVNVPDGVDLLVLRSTEIDSQLENNPDSTLALIPNTLRLIRVALNKLKGMGFSLAVVATDHGFFLNSHAEAGDVCAKPPGTWPLNAHDRMLLGSGTSDAHSLVVGVGKLGIASDCAQAALPRSMAPYRAGYLYFHGGASLPEAVVPVLSVRLDAAQEKDVAKVGVELTYRGGAKRITTRLPVVEARLVTSDLFTSELEILLEAQDAGGNVVGSPRGGGDIDSTTGSVVLTPGQATSIPIRMDPSFEGKFTIKAMNPTTLSLYASLSLETDYTV